MKMQDRPFEQLIEKAGYTSVAQFAEACYMYPQQVFKYIREENKPSVAVMVIFANNLGMKFMDIVRFFYPEAMSNLQEKLR